MTFDDLHIPTFQLPPNSRIWIYQAHRNFSPDEESLINLKTSAFINDWFAHGTKLMAEFQVVLHRFIIVAVNAELSYVSGCSIDKLFRFIQQLQHQLGISLLNRLQVAYWHQPTRQIRSFNLDQLEKLLTLGDIKLSTLIFDNTIQQLGEINTHWVRPLSQSWLSSLIHASTQ